MIRRLLREWRLRGTHTEVLVVRHPKVLPGTTLVVWVTQR